MQIPAAAALAAALSFVLPQEPLPKELGPKEAPPAEATNDAAAIEARWDAFSAAAEEKHGAFGRTAAEFLREHKNPLDDAVELQWLVDNLDLALAARAKYPWAKDLSDDLFLNDVLPYAILDETRENWRPALVELVTPIVAECKTAVEAAQEINRQLFDKIGVHYNTGRKRPNACASESIAQGRATCTGLTILYVEACRAVAIPARAAGVRLWHDDRGNHTWPELWDGERWRFTGADEYDAAGLDRAWFVADAARAKAGDRDHAVWATSWRTTGHTFPLAWRRGPSPVHAVEVTARYAGGAEVIDAALQQLGDDGAVLGEEASQRLVMELWGERSKALAAELEREMEAKAIQAAGQTLRYEERVFGEAPAAGHSLWISMHGGGGAPPRVNDQQWKNQIGLYEPAEGIYVAPRAPGDTWDLWHQGHIDPLFDRLITAYVTRRGVDPNRVYLMGYSAGGDGVYQVAPRFADRLAAAAMMAGHPNETQPDGLRNLAFALFMGGRDGAYDRNRIAAEWKEKLAALRAADPGGYDHEVTIYPDKGHWMDREDASALPWMAERKRRNWPSKVVWLQDDVTHTRFYWLGVDADDAKGRARVVAEIDGDTVRIQSEDVPRLTLWLHDRLIDLDRPVKVEWNGKRVFEGEVPRTRAAIEASLDARPDPNVTATARLDVMRPE